MVSAERLRFDFTHDRAASLNEIEAVERLVNLEIEADHPVKTDLMAMDEAVRSGAMALFEERYGEEVRVVSMGPSRELCGGTHAVSTGRLGSFSVISESAVSAGVRRLECLTGQAALFDRQVMRRRLGEAVAALKVKPEELVDRINKMRVRIKDFDKNQTKAGSFSGQDPVALAKTAEIRGGIALLASQVEAADPKALRELGDVLRNRLGPSAVTALAARTPEGKAILLVTVGPELRGRLKAGELVSAMAAAVGGRGGGKPEMAQAGGPDPSGIPQALKKVSSLVFGN
jgi:alanyl-tRNA synthetase